MRSSLFCQNICRFLKVCLKFYLLFGCIEITMINFEN
nr:MAG TPA: hypothetical protein [Caudoviricetes sp.]